METAGQADFAALVKGWGISPTLAQSEALAENLDSTHLTEAEKRRVARWHEDYADSIATRQRERYEGLAESLSERYVDLREELEIFKEEAETLTEDLQLGKVPLNEAKRQLQAIFHAIEATRARIDQLADSADMGWGIVSQPSAEYQKDLLDKFPTLKEKLPRLDQRVLNGERNFK